MIGNTSQHIQRNDDNLEVVNISDEEDNGNGVLVKLNNQSNQLALKAEERTQYSIMDAAIKSPDTSFVLQPVREVQRPNKLLRSRAPLNQQKCKDSSNMKIVLTLPDTSPLNSNEIDTNILEHEMVPLHLKPQNEYDNLPQLNRMDGTKSSQGDKSVSNAISSVTQSAVTSFVHPVSSFEPELVLNELVLSPAKLGQ